MGVQPGRPPRQEAEGELEQSGVWSEWIIFQIALSFNHSSKWVLLSPPRNSEQVLNIPPFINQAHLETTHPQHRGSLKRGRGALHSVRLNFRSLTKTNSWVTPQVQWERRSRHDIIDNNPKTHIWNVFGILVYRYNLVATYEMKQRKLDEFTKPLAHASWLSAFCLSSFWLQVIQTVSAVDKDDPIQGHYFNYRLVPEMLNNPNFTIKNNQGG